MQSKHHTCKHELCIRVYVCISSQLGFNSHTCEQGLSVSPLTLADHKIVNKASQLTGYDTSSTLGVNGLDP